MRVVLALLTVNALAQVPVIELKNAAAPGTLMPLVGLGTGGYGGRPQPWGVYPECWSDGAMGSADCSAVPLNATVNWLKLGGVRIDNADSYRNQKTIGAAIKASGVPRDKVFIVTKTGSDLPQGFNETLQQIDQVLTDMGVAFVDLVLDHWPTSPSASSDPACSTWSPTHSPKACRLSTWRALLQAQAAGKAKAVGVSNYNVDHLQELLDAGLPLPAVNQCPYTPHLYKAQAALVAFCKAHNIVFNAYSSLGVPDWHKYPPSLGAPTLLQDAQVKAIASAHGKTPAQILLNWQASQGIPFNPRTNNQVHMAENLAVFDFTLTAAELQILSSFPQNSCKEDPWYECCGDVNVQPSIPSCGL